MNLEKLNRQYTPAQIKFRRNWVNLFRESNGNPIQKSAMIVFISFGISMLLFFTGFEEISPIPFLLGFSFILISVIYFRIYPLSWNEMNDLEKKVFREFQRLPTDWTIND